MKRQFKVGDAVLYERDKYQPAIVHELKRTYYLVKLGDGEIRSCLGIFMEKIK